MTMAEDSVELWRPVAVPDFALVYEVSSHGNVRRVGRPNLTPMMTGSRRQSSQRAKVRFSTHPRRDYEVGALVLSTFVSTRPDGAVVMHLNDDARDNRLCNVKWGSPSENMVDSAKKGRCSRQKLTSENAAYIRTARAAGVTGAALAKKFGVSQQRICDVYKGRSVL